MIGVSDDGSLTFDVRQARVLEQPERKLESEDATHGFINTGLLKKTLRHGRLRSLKERRRRHDHVVARVHRRRSRLGEVREEPLLAHEIAHVVPVSDEHALVAPLVTEHIAQ